MTSRPPLHAFSRCKGITLLEVLIAMFVLAVGILSIFGLFAAGREMEKRALLLQRAMAYADGPGLAEVRNWMSVGKWLHYDTGWRWVHSVTTPDAAAFRVRLPLMIDPVSLASGTANVPSTSGTSPWDWNRVAPAQPFTAGGLTAFALKRVTLARFNRPTVPANDSDNLIDPFTRDVVFNNAGDPDDVRFELDATAPDNPPLNAFALGRRARHSDLVPALFIANRNPAALGAIEPVFVSRWILIHHNPLTGYETAATDPNQTWPAGSLEFLVTLETPPVTITDNSILTLSLERTPKDDTVIRRTLQPGRWLLFVQELPLSPGAYEAAWIQISNITRRPPDSWMVLLEQQALIAGWDSSRTRCFAFESIIHVKQLSDAPLSVP